ncbi:MAG TPA: hypothetical protein VFW98_01620 [Gemmatimonadaceae bacterium]|nr:hypothetical protein [Gemmatimonadaceae bacterium]
MDEKQLIALARRNAAKAQAKAKTRPVYDATLEATRPAEPEKAVEAERLFREMKRREF